MLIALGGLPGVGKSALAVALARRIGAVHIRIDTIEQAMRNAGFTVSGPEGYLAARDLARDNLRIGRTVIVDSVNPLDITRFASTISSSFARSGGVRVAGLASTSLSAACSSAVSASGRIIAVSSNR